jgi:serine/threonine-protein kinase
VTSDGTVKLLDFGVAKLLEQNAPGARPTTRTTHRWMTPDYAAPEQIRGKAITPRTDVYQLGAALYELLAGHTPFGHCGDTIHELERAILDRDPDSLGQTLGGDLDAIVLKALRKNPDERYASASEFADDVRRHLTGHPVRARRQTVGYLTRRFVHRNRFRLGLAAGILTLLVPLLIAISVEEARSRRALAELASRAGIADSVPTFVNELLALSSTGGLTDTAAARRSRAGAEWRTRGQSPVNHNDRPGFSRRRALSRRIARVRQCVRSASGSARHPPPARRSRAPWQSNAASEKADAGRSTGSDAPTAALHEALRA